jgi:hypothetical protein
MRIDIENSPGAQAGHFWPTARDSLGQRLQGDGAMFGNCLCCMLLRDPCRERRVASSNREHGNGVYWHHAASTLNAAQPGGGGGRPSGYSETTISVSIAPVRPQPLQWSKYRLKRRLAKSQSLP